MLEPPVLDLRDADDLIRSGETPLSAGRAARGRLGLDKWDHHPAPVRIRIPDDTRFLHPEFLAGLIGRSVEHFRDPDRFFSHYEFDGNPFLISQIQRSFKYTRFKEDRRSSSDAGR